MYFFLCVSVQLVAYLQIVSAKLTHGGEKCAKLLVQVAGISDQDAES
jgi:hypothetical protein